ncbi:hypothetical protein Angca_005808, partial [Angiostrongylus cantonensis]
TMGSEMILFSDIFMINKHHGCNTKCNKSTSANGGFPHLRKCSKCVCLDGYGGPLRDKRPPGCGEDLIAIADKQVVDLKLGMSPGLKNKFDFCNYMI